MVGMVVGVIPGFGPSAGLAILLPVTFGMDPIGAIMMLAAIYYGAMYGGTITSILLNTPGESATVASTLDGFPLAVKGRAGPALVMQAVASFVGGTVGVILITILAPLFSQVSRSFGPPEYFLLATMGMLTLIVMIGANWKLGCLSALIGFALGTVGVDLETGQGRYTFGSAELIGGIYFIPIAIGLFRLGRAAFTPSYTWPASARVAVLDRCSSRRRSASGLTRRTGSARAGRCPRLRSSASFVGVIPGGGATIASLMASTRSSARSRAPVERSVRGEMAGLVAPETANNRGVRRARWIPLPHPLGIPGSASPQCLLGRLPCLWA